MFRQRPSLLQNAALLAIAAVAPLLVLSAGSALVAYYSRQSGMRAEAVGDAQRLSETLDRVLAADVDAAEALAASPTLDPPQNLAGFQEIARREQARHPLWRTVTLTDTMGRRLVNTLDPARLGMALDSGSLPLVVRTGKPVVADVARGYLSYAIPVRAPVIRAGRVTSVVTVVVLPDGIAEALAASKLPPAWVATVVDRSGKVVARTRNAQAFLGKSASANALEARRERQGGAYEGYTLEGLDTISAFWTSPTYGWSVHIGIPRAGFEAPLRRQLLLTVAGFVLSLLLAALFVGLLLRSLRQRRSEAAAMEQSSRMEALGRLTGGVAHDFNNLLMIIQGNAELLQRRLAAETAERPLAAIRDATARAAKLTQELLVFARGGQTEPSVLDLNATLSEFLGSIRQAVGAGVEVRTQFEEAELAVEVDRVQLELAVLNLAVNARDAMPDGGFLTLATTRFAPDQIQLSVADTGQGMSEEVRAKVFDPFFTTKPPGLGTGLGLTQVYGFVRHAGGGIEVQSRPGKGATIVMRLPAASRTLAPERPIQTEAPSETSFVHQRVLVIDDNAEVRRLTTIYLRERGAEVIEGESGLDGLAALGRGRFDAVVSDIVMPGEVDGLALAETVRDRWPGLPVLLVSGYSASLAEAGARGFPILRKPYDLEALARLLGEALKDRADA